MNHSHQTQTSIETPTSPILFYSLLFGFLAFIALFVGYLPHANAGERDLSDSLSIQNLATTSAERTISSDTKEIAKNLTTVETTATESNSEEVTHREHHSVRD